MRSKSIILLVLALGCGLVASIGISQVMDRNKTPNDPTEKQPVFVALADIKSNEELTAQNIKLEEWPKNIIPQGALTKLEEVEGKRTRIKIYTGEPILSSKLLGADDMTGAARDIPPGYRVAHVKVDSVTGSSNLILPGDRVDVLVFRNPTNSDSNTTAAKIVLQDIKVFAVDTHTETEFSRTKNEQNDAITAKTISLLVTPQQSVILHAASEISGAVRLVLRNPGDDAHVEARGATIGDIFGSDQASDRDAESAKKEKEKGALGDWLEQQKQQAAQSAAAPTAPAAPPAPGRRMVVLFGSKLTQIDIPGNGELPNNPPSDNWPNPAAGGEGSQLTGANGGAVPLPPIEGSDGQEQPTDGN